MTYFAIAFVVVLLVGSLAIKITAKEQELADKAIVTIIGLVIAAFVLAGVVAWAVKPLFDVFQ
jgi:hypothetical protein